MGDATQVLATAVAGGLVVPLVQLLRRYTGLKGTPLAWAAYVVSWVVGALVVLVTGEADISTFADPGKLFVQGSAVWGVAYMIYRMAIKGKEAG